jgi:large subunit ribosomal protein L21
MFAVIADGGRQYRVEEGDLLLVDYRADAEPGQMLTFDNILLANGGAASLIGKPTLSGATVSGEVVVGEYKGPKLEIQKFRRRHASRRHTGHRQKHTRVKITSISVPDLEITAPAESAQQPES